jgi:hypothetical protein
MILDEFTQPYRKDDDGTVTDMAVYRKWHTGYSEYLGCDVEPYCEWGLLPNAGNEEIAWYELSEQDFNDIKTGKLNISYC